MARVNLYVSDELRARMNEAGDALNWSDIARPAFEAALANHNHRKGQTMQTAIERLRASKVQHEQRQNSDGKDQGRAWALNKAEFAELKAVAALAMDENEYEFDEYPLLIKHAVDPSDREELSDVSERLFGTRRWPDFAILPGWIMGAGEAFEEIEDEL